MKWVKSCLCFLQVEVALLWVQCSRVCLALYLKLKGKSMSLNSRARVEQMIISLDSKSNFLKAVIQSLFLILVGLLLFVVLGLTACASSSAPSSHRQSSYRSQMQQGKAGQNGYSDSSPTHPRKTQSSSLLDTSPIWGRPVYVPFLDFILAPVQADDNGH